MPGLHPFASECPATANNGSMGKSFSVRLERHAQTASQIRKLWSHQDLARECSPKPCVHVAQCSPACEEKYFDATLRALCEACEA